MYNRRGGFLEDFRNAFNKPNNSHVQLIIINVVIFVALGIIDLASDSAFRIINAQFTIPATINTFFTRPWTIITYAFNHSGIFHILFNMLWFYWFGRLVIEYMGNKKLVHIYILGALAGAVAFLVTFNTIPVLMERGAAMSPLSGMVGASAAVTAIIVAAATLIPNYTFFLLFFGPVRIKYIALFYIVISILGLDGPNAGGDIAHLGGALIGFVYVKQLQKGNDLGGWIEGILRFFRSFFVKQSKVKVSYRSKAESTARRGKVKVTASDASQEEIDAILDKISQHGYESLTNEEKQKLFNASKK